MSSVKILSMTKKIIRRTCSMEKYSQEVAFIKDKAKAKSVLEEVIIEGARKMLKLALENEVEEFITKHSNLVDEDGKKIVSRNGYMPQREILTGIGPLTIKQPRVDDRNLKTCSRDERFSSNILPRYLRRIPSIDNSSLPCTSKEYPQMISGQPFLLYWEKGLRVFLLPI